MVFIVGIPSALSSGGSEFFTNMEVTVFGATSVGFQAILDYFFGTFFIVVVAFATCLYVAWKLPISTIVGELAEGSETFKPGGFASNAFVFFIRYVCPIVILAVLLNMMGVFGVFAGA
jgi:NSS family neurotransmitter:Na+ symporter